MGNSRRFASVPRILAAWLYGGTSQEYRTQIDRAAGLTVISPTWWYLDPDKPGGIELDTDEELVSYAHDRGVAVWPLFGNHIDPDPTDQVLRDPELRQRVVEGIVGGVRTPAWTWSTSTSRICTTTPGSC